MSEKEFTLIDLECKGCGKSFEPDERKGFKVDKLDSGGLMFTQNDDPYYFTCPYCGKKAMTWKPGEATKSYKGNGFSGAVAIGNGAKAVGAGGIIIEGGMSGSNIVIGHGNKLG